jgi:hypothetical protein
VLTGLLRQELGFDGLVFTDSMSMHAISRRFSPDRAAALAVAAGTDVVLDSPDAEAAVRGIREPVQKGEIPRRPGRPLGGAPPPGQGPARLPPDEDRRRGGGSGGPRRTRPPGGGGRGRGEGDHAAEGRPRPGPPRSLADVDLADAKARLGGRLFLKGHVDPVGTVLLGTPEAVLADARGRIAIGAPGGGYVLSTACSVPPGAPPENVRALRAASEAAS